MGLALLCPMVHLSPEQKAILTPDALAFVSELHRLFNPTRLELLKRRAEIQRSLSSGLRPVFPPESASLRRSDWKIASVPSDLRDRRVEITGPVDRKMMINALNSGANVFMADFEDSHSPTWEATLNGQVNLRDAVRGRISYDSPEGKSYRLAEKTATLMVRPRGWHLPEAHLEIEGQPASASLFDFGLYIFHNARELLARGSGPYFYIPKLENRLEARLWNDVFTHAQKALGLPHGSIKATVLIETILAAFEMDEILYELRDHAVGLNCGRWDYIFSFIKKFRLGDFALLPDRSMVTMAAPFLKSYSELLIRTAHRRGAHAMGGMAAQIPIKQITEEDARAQQSAMHAVWHDKDREVSLGHDGTWVAHPGLVGLARTAFDAKMKSPNQLSVFPGGTDRISEQELENEISRLLAPPPGLVTEQGVRKNLRVPMIYLESWLRGSGCVPIDHLMEDAATAEISRAQIWQWLRHPSAALAGGQRLTEPLLRTWLTEEFERIELERGPSRVPKLRLARNILEDLVFNDRFAEFMTLAAYPQISGEFSASRQGRSNDQAA